MTELEWYLKDQGQAGSSKSSLGHFYTCHDFGHMAIECKIRKNSSIKFQEQRKGWKRMEAVNQKSQRFLKYEGSFYGYCHYCHKFGHKVVECRIKRKYLIKESKKQTRLVSRVPHGKIWRRKADSKGEEETNISNIKEVSQDDEEHNSVVDKNGIHYDGKHDEYVKEHIDDDK